MTVRTVTIDYQPEANDTITLSHRHAENADHGWSTVKIESGSVAIVIYVTAATLTVTNTLIDKLKQAADLAVNAKMPPA